MTILDDFKLDADITVSELRHEDILDERLRSFRRLRVRRRNDVFAILVGADEWRNLAAYVRDLEAQLERHEGEAVRRILAARLPDAEFVAATPDVIDDIGSEYRKLIGE
jgi:hypothetical protein